MFGKKKSYSKVERTSPLMFSSTSWK